MRLFRNYSNTVRFKLHLEYSIMGSSSTWNSWFMMNSFCPLAREKYTHFAVASFFSLFFLQKVRKWKKFLKKTFFFRLSSTYYFWMGKGKKKVSK